MRFRSAYSPKRHQTQFAGVTGEGDERSAVNVEDADGADEGGVEGESEDDVSEAQTPVARTMENKCFNISFHLN